MLKKLSLFMMLIVPLLAGADDKRDVLGFWETDEKSAIVFINEDENGLPLNGIVTQFTTKPEKKGTILLSNFSSHKDGWSTTLYSPRRDKHFDAVIYRKGQELNLEIDVGFFTHHVIWTAQSN